MPAMVRCSMQLRDVFLFPDGKARLIARVLLEVSGLLRAAAKAKARATTSQLGTAREAMVLVQVMGICPQTPTE